MELAPLEMTRCASCHAEFSPARTVSSMWRSPARNDFRSGSRQGAGRDRALDAGHRMERTPSPRARRDRRGHSVTLHRDRPTTGGRRCRDDRPRWTGVSHPLSPPGVGGPGNAGRGNFRGSVASDPPLNPRGEITTGLAIQRLTGLGHPRARGTGPAVGLKVGRRPAERLPRSYVRRDCSRPEAFDAGQTGGSGRCRNDGRGHRGSARFQRNRRRSEGPR